MKTVTKKKEKKHSCNTLGVHDIQLHNKWGPWETTEDRDACLETNRKRYGHKKHGAQSLIHGRIWKLIHGSNVDRLTYCCPLHHLLHPHGDAQTIRGSWCLLCNCPTPTDLSSPPPSFCTWRCSYHTWQLVDNCCPLPPSLPVKQNGNIQRVLCTTLSSLFVCVRTAIFQIYLEFRIVVIKSYTHKSIFFLHCNRQWLS